MKTSIKILTLFLIFLALSCKKDEEITPTPAPGPKSSAKDITKFSFETLNPVVEATIDATAKTIKATLPAGTDVTKLVPTITISDKATLSPATGVAQDFSKEVSYRVTAENGTSQLYKVTITVTQAVPAKIIDANNIPDVLEDLSDGVDYVIKTFITLSGNRVITVKPGVKIQFEGADIGISVRGQAALKMIGTAAKPIILEGKVASAGSWKGISLISTNTDNQWEYVTIRHAGGSPDKAALWLAGIDTAIRVSVKNCTFTDNIGYGIYDADDIYAGNHFTGFENNVFTNNTKAALRIRLSEMGSLDSKSSYANNGLKYIEVGKSTNTSNVALNVKKLDVPYRITKYFNILEKITINPGVIMEFTPDAGFQVSYNSKNATIVANGTAAEPIRFIGYIANTKGLWKGFDMQSSNPETSFTYCIIDGAGSKGEMCSGDRKAALSFGAYSCGTYPGRGTVSNCTISNSGGYGIVFKTGDNVPLKDNTFKDNTTANIYNF